MDIHKPKPWHGWREFLNEYLIIFIGVLTALAAEQGAEWLHWRHEVAGGREALHREMAFDAAYFRDRVTVGRCLDRRLGQIGVALDAAAARKPTSIAIPLRGPGRLTVTSEWNTQQASQTLTHLPLGELSKLGLWYDQTMAMQRWMDQEEDAWAKLAALNSPQALGPADLALLRQDLQRARYLQDLMTLNAQRQLDRVRELGVQPEPPRQDYIQAKCRDSIG